MKVKVIRKGDTVQVGVLRIKVLPNSSPSPAKAAEIRASGWAPQTRDFSGAEGAESLEKQIRSCVAHGWTLNLRQRDGSLLKIDLSNLPTQSLTIKRDGLEIQ